MCQNFDLTHKPPLTHCLGSLAGIIVFFLNVYFYFFGMGIDIVLKAHFGSEKSPSSPSLVTPRERVFDAG